MISEDSASPFFAFSCGLAAVVLTHHPSRLERWNVGRPRKPEAAFWVCFLAVFTSPTILEGGVFSGGNLMALIYKLPCMSILFEKLLKSQKIAYSKAKQCIGMVRNSSKLFDYWSKYSMRTCSGNR